MSTIAGEGTVLLIGSACYDVRGVTGAAVAPGGVSEGRVRLSLGGTARNIAENLARLGVTARLLTALGDDLPGRLILQRTRDAGVCLEDETLLLHAGRPSAAFLTIGQAGGEAIVAIDDTAITRTITPRVIHRWRHALREAAIVVVDATLRPQTLAAIVRRCRRAGLGICLEPVSVALAPRLGPFLGDALLLTPNMREAAILTGLPVTDRDEALVAARALHDRGAAMVIVTMAGGGAIYASADASGHVPALQTTAVDNSGAGDALTAGVIFGLLQGFPLDEAVTLGTAMASLTLLTSETVRADLSLEGVYAHMQA